MTELIDDLKDAGVTDREIMPQTEFYGIYRGTVEDVDDPEYRGRVRCRIEGVHDFESGKLPTDILPWAESGMSSGGASNQGDFNVPYHADIQDGDTVWIMFNRGNPDMPVYVGTFWGARPPTHEDPECPDEAWLVHDTDDVSSGVRKE